ncbi:drug resistance transporter, EmrB/QacA subfamily [Luteibacter sp. UNC138MFCol5.1]|uniref:MFS transporter n=1 Tax=Luteibacter sp. UNC138MFCol5.1 TaxID=1502774 RepID=UPI0008D596A6|nr:MFS transporter [Luteibacter sp. UNC138MFCol5.1]SEO54036.1 drug resistance transporter, EmrB/QacA subfamily [Luteibacter sp. UNC138MFCol5.1]
MPPSDVANTEPTDVQILPTDRPALAPAEPSSRARYRGLIWLVSAAFFMQALDSTIVNTAVPAISGALAVTPLSMRTALTSYVLTLAIFIPMSPWLCDRFGTRRVFGGAILVFALGSLLCGVAQSLPQLVVSRIIQGLGGAALMPVGRYVLVRSIDRREFVSSMTTVATFGLLGSVFGPLLGGALVEYTNWRLIFLINVPVGLVGLLLNRREMPDYRLDRAHRFDTSGFLLFAGASALCLMAAETLGGDGHGLLVAAYTAGAVALGTLYVRHSRRTAYPVSDLSLLKVRSVWVSLAGNLFTRLGVSGMYLLLVLFLQIGCGWSPLTAGLMMVPQAIGSIAVKPFIDRLLTHFGYRRLLLGNTILVAIVLCAFALLSPSTPPLVIAAFVFVYGAVMSVQYTSMNTLAYVDLDVKYAAMASSMASTAQYLSMSFGIALASLLMAGFLGSHAAEGYVWAFRWSVIVMGMITLAASWIFGRLRDTRATPPETAGAT